MMVFRWFGVFCKAFLVWWLYFFGVLFQGGFVPNDGELVVEMVVLALDADGGSACILWSTI